MFYLLLVSVSLVFIYAVYKLFQNPKIVEHFKNVVDSCLLINNDR
jgi:hypothetical protein